MWWASSKGDRHDQSTWQCRNHLTWFVIRASPSHLAPLVPTRFESRLSVVSVFEAWQTWSDDVTVLRWSHLIHSESITKPPGSFSTDTIPAEIECGEGLRSATDMIRLRDSPSMISRDLLWEHYQATWLLQYPYDSSRDWVWWASSKGDRHDQTTWQCRSHLTWFVIRASPSHLAPSAPISFPRRSSVVRTYEAWQTWSDDVTVHRWSHPIHSEGIIKPPGSISTHTIRVEIECGECLRSATDMIRLRDGPSMFSRDSFREYHQAPWLYQHR